jgi:hypothetical protein
MFISFERRLYLKNKKGDPNNNTGNKPLEPNTPKPTDVDNPFRLKRPDEDLYVRNCEGDVVIGSGRKVPQRPGAQ